MEYEKHRSNYNIFYINHQLIKDYIKKLIINKCSL